MAAVTPRGNAVGEDISAAAVQAKVKANNNDDEDGIYSLLLKGAAIDAEVEEAQMSLPSGFIMREVKR